MQAYSKCMARGLWISCIYQHATIPGLQVGSLFLLNKEAGVCGSVLAVICEAAMGLRYGMFSWFSYLC